MASAARGTRGDYQARPGDVTGARFVANSEVKADYDRAKTATRNALTDEPLELVRIGPRVYAIPRVVAEYLRSGDE